MMRRDKGPLGAVRWRALLRESPEHLLSRANEVLTSHVPALRHEAAESHRALQMLYLLGEVPDAFQNGAAMEFLDLLYDILCDAELRRPKDSFERSTKDGDTQAIARGLVAAILSELGLHGAAGHWIAVLAALVVYILKKGLLAFCATDRR